MNIFTGKEVHYQYKNNQIIIDNLDFSIKEGSLTAILGKNGCGKSTLIKLMTALLPLKNGIIMANGTDINTSAGSEYLRKHCGIVFQNPDNQFVSPIISDDIRFGLKNHKISSSEYDDRIKMALEKVKLSGFENRLVSTLSGGQKQRAAAAGILAIENNILFFDEATSMLDPDGRMEMIQCIKNLKNNNCTIIIITQNIDDVFIADKVLLMSEHKILAAGSVREILTDYELLSKAGVQIPFPVRVYHDLKNQGIHLPFCPLTIDELSEAVCNWR